MYMVSCVCVHVYKSRCALVTGGWVVYVLANGETQCAVHVLNHFLYLGQDLMSARSSICSSQECSAARVGPIAIGSSL